MTFKCSHPREAEDRRTDYCRTCSRVRIIVAKAEREQKRINAKRFYWKLGERIARGLA